MSRGFEPALGRRAHRHLGRGRASTVLAISGRRTATSGSSPGLCCRSGADHLRLADHHVDHRALPRFHLARRRASRLDRGRDDRSGYCDRRMARRRSSLRGPNTDVRRIGHRTRSNTSRSGALLVVRSPRCCAAARGRLIGGCMRVAPACSKSSSLPERRRSSASLLSSPAPAGLRRRPQLRSWSARRGNVSLLSPYLRRRMITEREVCAAALCAHTLDAAEKFIQEVLWRTYWKGWLEMRPGVWMRYRRDLDQQREALDRNGGFRRDWRAAVEGRTGSRASTTGRRSSSRQATCTTMRGCGSRRSGSSRCGCRGSSARTSS